MNFCFSRSLSLLIHTAKNYEKHGFNFLLIIKYINKLSSHLICILFSLPLVSWAVISLYFLYHIIFECIDLIFVLCWYIGSVMTERWVLPNFVLINTWGNVLSKCNNNALLTIYTYIHAVSVVISHATGHLTFLYSPTQVLIPSNWQQNFLC